MPMTIDSSYDAFDDLRKKANYKYDYTNGLDLKPDSEFHRVLLSRLMRMAQESRSAMEPRYSVWQKLDQELEAYIPRGTTEKKKGDYKTKATKTTIVPVLAEVLETQLSQMAATFLDQPMFKYKGVDSTDTLGAILMEKAIEIQSTKLKVGLSLHTVFRDSLIYAVGVGVPSWVVKRGKKVVKEKSGLFYTKEKKTLKHDQVLFEGSKVVALDPYDIFPDPNVSISDVQDGEFFGWITRTNRMSLITEENIGKTKLFNVKYLKGKSNVSGLHQIYRDAKSKVERSATSDDTSHPVDVIVMLVRLVPSEWGLSKRNDVQYWRFEVAGDKYIIAANELDLPYDGFPVAVCAPEYDGHSIMPISKLEKNYGMQNIIDFLISSHMANVKKSINVNMVVDPKLVNMNDVSNPVPGGAIRLRQSAWGKGIKDAIQQLAVVDVTRNHIGDINSLISLIFSNTGASGNLRGQQRMSGPERVTAVEAKGQQFGSLVRIDRSVRVASLMFMIDMGYMLAANLQWYMSEPVYIDLLGRHEAELRRIFEGEQGETDVDKVKVSPLDIVVNYDLVPHDGTVVGRENAEMAMEMLRILLEVPEIAARFDIPRFVMYIAQLMGMKNLGDFVLKQPVATQEQVAQLQEQLTNPATAEELLAAGI